MRHFGLKVKSEVTDMISDLVIPQSVTSIDGYNTEAIVSEFIRRSLHCDEKTADEQANRWINSAEDYITVHDQTFALSWGHKDGTFDDDDDLVYYELYEVKIEFVLIEPDDMPF